VMNKFTKKIENVQPAQDGVNTGQQQNRVTTAGQTPNEQQFVKGPTAFDHPSEDVRAQFGQQPRWVIDESMIKQVKVSTREQDRVNFVQVWGRNQLLNYGPPSATNSSNSIEEDRQAQLSAGNMVADDNDIKRNGLRVNQAESPFDYPLPFNSRAPLWARMRADWLFNGHLKAQGNVVLNGVREPIAEGDNCEVRGIVYHIQDVTHEGSIAASGRKSFTTTLTIFNGITAQSLDSGKLPSYLIHQGPDANAQKFIPGLTEIENTTRITTK
jgi:hypothetical protein